MKTLGLCVLLGLGLTGCATVEGLGKDIQSAGQKIEKAADRY